MPKTPKKLVCSVLFLVAWLTARPTLTLTPFRTVESETAMFHTMDLNSDGLVTFEEYYTKMWTDKPGDQRFLNMARKDFQELDKNGDGVITLEECLARIQQQKPTKP
ncbi:MAG: hypothetical protein ACUVXF_02475 [Desulfobaccales bacterium]